MIVAFRDVVDTIAHDRPVPVSAIISAATPPPTAPTSLIPRPPRRANPPASPAPPEPPPVAPRTRRPVRSTALPSHRDPPRRVSASRLEGSDRTPPASRAPPLPGARCPSPGREGAGGARSNHRDGPHDRRPLPPPFGRSETAAAKGVRRRAQPRPRRSGRGDAPGRPRPSPGLAKACPPPRRLPHVGDVIADGTVEGGGDRGRPVAVWAVAHADARPRSAFGDGCPNAIPEAAGVRARHFEFGDCFIGTFGGRCRGGGSRKTHMPLWR